MNNVCQKSHRAGQDVRQSIQRNPLGGKHRFAFPNEEHISAGSLLTNLTKHSHYIFKLIYYMTW